MHGTSSSKRPSTLLQLLTLCLVLLAAVCVVREQEEIFGIVAGVLHIGNIKLAPVSGPWDRGHSSPVAPPSPRGGVKRFAPALSVPSDRPSRRQSSPSALCI